MHVCIGKGGNCILQVSKSGVHVCRGGILNFSRGYIRIHEGGILKWRYEFWGCSMAILRSSIFWGGGGEKGCSTSGREEGKSCCFIICTNWCPENGS